MTTTHAASLDGRDVPLPEETITAFRSTLRGQTLIQGDPGYDDARLLWNRMHDKHPAIVARCTGNADVIAAVNFARENGLLVSVRGGGHNVAGNAIIDGGITIDLSPMKSIHVDPVRQTARAGGGVVWGEFDRETQLHGLVTPGGEVTTTGIGGFTLGGGMGVIRRKWGLTCDNLCSADVVTADGRVLRASADEHPDLFWALRGGGGNFGVVTSFEYDVHPLGPEVYTCAVIFPLEEALSVTRQYHEFVLAAPDEVTCDILYWNMPPFTGLPMELVGLPIVAVAGMYAGDPETGAEVFHRIPGFGTPILDLSGVVTYVESQMQFDEILAEEGCYYWKSISVNEFSDDVIDTVIRHAWERPSIKTPIGIRHLGGAIERVPEDETAFGNRQAQFNISIDSSWVDPKDAEQNITWTRQAWQELHDLTQGGVYLNFAGFGEAGDPLPQLAYRGNIERLREVKRRYDPLNLFRGNVNIKP